MRDAGAESQKSFYQEAEEEAMVLSLDPKTKKKKNIPRQLKPIIPASKIKGNFAA